MEALEVSSWTAQLHLFDPDAYLITHPGLKGSQLPPWSEGSHSSIKEDLQGRPGFLYERTPVVFGRRRGYGPLLAGLDTSILIALREALEKPDGDLGFLVQPLWSDLETLEAALRDLVQLWWWRDVRFWVGDIHSEDAPDTLGKENAQARESAIEELQRDLVERGGFPAEAEAQGETAPDLRSVDPGVHSRDFEIARAALKAGCQVLLTADKGMRRWNRVVSSHGLLILTVGELLERLDDAGELDECSAMAFDAPAPDIAPMSRLYVGFG